MVTYYLFFHRAAYKWGRALGDTFTIFPVLFCLQSDIVTHQSALILKAPAAFASEPRADEVRAFFGTQPPRLLAGAERAIAQADEKVRTQARWLAAAEWHCDSE